MKFLTLPIFAASFANAIYSATGQTCTRNMDCITTLDECCVASKTGQKSLYVCAPRTKSTVGTGTYSTYTFTCPAIPKDKASGASSLMLASAASVAAGVYYSI